MALKDDLIEKALRRTKSSPKKLVPNSYNHFKIYELPPTAIIEQQLDTKRTQTEHKQHMNWTKTAHKPDTNRTQTGHRITKTKEFYSFVDYVGLQRKILLLFYNECKNNLSTETQEVTLKRIADILEIKLGSIKTSIRRLEAKGAIQRIQFKNGRNGWSKYELNEVIYKEIMLDKTRHKLDTVLTKARV